MTAYLCRHCRKPTTANAVTCAGCGGNLDKKNRLVIPSVGTASQSATSNTPNVAPLKPVTSVSPSSSEPSATEAKLEDSSYEAPAQETPSSPADQISDLDGTSQASSKLTTPPKRSSSKVFERKKKKVRRSFGSVAPGRADPEPAVLAAEEGKGDLSLDDRRHAEPESRGTVTAKGAKKQRRRKNRTRSSPCPACGSPVIVGKMVCESCWTDVRPPKGHQPHRRPQRGRDAWHRRLRGTTRYLGSDTRSWSQRLTDSGLDGQLRHGANLTSGSRLGLASVAALGIVVFALALGPFRDNIITLVDRPDDLISYELGFEGAVVPVPGGEGELVADGSIQTGLMLAWPESAVPSTCGLTGPGIRLTFAPDTPPARMRIFVGIDPPDEAESARLWPGPKSLSILGGGGCGEFQFSDEGDFGVLDVSEVAAGGNSLTIRIHDRFEDADFQSYDVVVFGEIELVG